MDSTHSKASYRKHDYDYGRSVAQQNLKRYQSQSGDIFATLHWTPKPIYPLTPDLNHVDLSRVDEATVRTLPFPRTAPAIPTPPRCAGTG
jgi:hypothetical protein